MRLLHHVFAWMFMMRTVSFSRGEAPKFESQSAAHKWTSATVLLPSVIRKNLLSFEVQTIATPQQSATLLKGESYDYVFLTYRRPDAILFVEGSTTRKELWVCLLVTRFRDNGDYSNIDENSNCGEPPLLDGAANVHTVIDKTGEGSSGNKYNIRTQWGVKRFDAKGSNVCRFEDPNDIKFYDTADTEIQVMYNNGQLMRVTTGAVFRDGFANKRWVQTAITMVYPRPQSMYSEKYGIVCVITSALTVGGTNDALTVSHDSADTIQTIIYSKELADSWSTDNARLFINEVAVSGPVISVVATARDKNSDLYAPKIKMMAALNAIDATNIEVTAAYSLFSDKWRTAKANKHIGIKPWPYMGTKVFKLWNNDGTTALPPASSYTVFYYLKMCRDLAQEKSGVDTRDEAMYDKGCRDDYIWQGPSRGQVSIHTSAWEHGHTGDIKDVAFSKGWECEYGSGGLQAGAQAVNYFNINGAYVDFPNYRYAGVACNNKYGQSNNTDGLPDFKHFEDPTNPTALAQRRQCGSLGMFAKVSPIVSDPSTLEFSLGLGDDPAQTVQYGAMVNPAASLLSTSTDTQSYPTLQRSFVGVTTKTLDPQYNYCADSNAADSRTVPAPFVATNPLSASGTLIQLDQVSFYKYNYADPLFLSNGFDLVPPQNNYNFGVFLNCENASKPAIDVVLVDIKPDADDFAPLHPWSIDAPKMDYAIFNPSTPYDASVVTYPQFRTPLPEHNTNTLCEKLKLGQSNSTETVRYDGGINGMGSSVSYDGRRMVTTVSDNDYALTIAVQHVFEPYVPPLPPPPNVSCSDGMYIDPGSAGQNCTACPSSEFKRGVFGSDQACRRRTECTAGEFLIWRGDAKNDNVCAIKSGVDHCPTNQYLAGEASQNNHTGIWTFKCMANDGIECPWTTADGDDRAVNFTANASGLVHSSVTVLINITQELEEYALNRTETGGDHPFKLVRFCANWKDCEMEYNEYETAAGTFTSDRECNFCFTRCAQTVYVDNPDCRYSDALEAPQASNAKNVHPASQFPELVESAGETNYGAECKVVPYLNANFCCRYKYDRASHAENAPSGCLSTTTAVSYETIMNNKAQYICQGQTPHYLNTTAMSTHVTTTTTTIAENKTSCNPGSYVNKEVTPHVCTLCTPGYYNPTGGDVEACSQVVQCGPNEVELPVPDPWARVHGNVCGSLDNVCDDSEFAIGEADYVAPGDSPNTKGIWIIRVNDTNAASGFNPNDLNQYTWNFTGDILENATAQPLSGEIRNVKHVRLCQPWTVCHQHDNLYQTRSPSETRDRTCAQCPVVRANTSGPFANASCNLRPNALGVYTTVVDQAECTGVSENNQRFCCRVGYDRQLQRYDLAATQLTCTQEEWAKRITTITTTTGTNYTTTSTETNTTTTTTTVFHLDVQKQKDEKAANTLGYVFFGIGGAGIVVLIVINIRQHRLGPAYQQLPSKKSSRRLPRKYF